MKKFACLALLAILATGCAYHTGRGGGGTIIRFLPRGLPLQITHTCTNHAEVFQAGMGKKIDLVGATPQDFYFDPVSLDGAVTVTLQSIDDQGKVVATHVQVFELYNRYRIVETWVISDRHSGGQGRYSSCRY